MPSRTKKRAPDRVPSAAGGANWAARLRRAARHHAEGGLVVLADDQQVVASLAAEEGRGRVLDRHRVAQPGLGRSGRSRARPAAASCAASRGFRASSAGASPSKTIGVRARTGLRCRLRAVDLLEVGLALLVRKPDDLEEVVALRGAVGVVVDRLAGPREPLGGQVVLGQDQERVDLAALECDPHGHLAERAPRQGEGAAQRLRAEVDVDAEGPALADQAVEQQGGLLRELVLLDEELLELVDDEQDPRHGGRAGGVAIAVQVLHAGVAEPVGPQPHLGVEPLEHADAELALALDGHDAGVRQLVGGVDLELDPLLEVDQVEIDLVGAVVEGEVGDQGVHQGRLARARPAGDQDVLAGPLAERQVLPLGGAGLAQRDVDPGAAVLRPPGVLRRGDELEGDLDALGVAGRRAHLLDLAGGELGGRWRIEGQRDRPTVGVVPGELAARPGQVGAVGAQVVECRSPAAASSRCRRPRA